jgi:hypothetical protein
MKFIKVFVFLFVVQYSLAQPKSRLSVEVNYGLGGNFFVRDYDERNIPGVGINFYNKNFVGTIGGVDVRYKIGKKSILGLGFARSINSRVVNFNGSSLSVPVVIDEFSIRHINNFYQLYFDRQLFKKKNDFSIQAGIYYLRMSQQELDISTLGASFSERKFKNNRLEEGGLFIGLQYSKQIENRFRVGIRSRLYYTASTNQFEAITLTPTLSYQF